LKAHPSILGWIVFDEPSRRWPNPPWRELASLVAGARAEDPERVVIINDNTWRPDASGQLAATDIGSIDIYRSIHKQSQTRRRRRRAAQSLLRII
jgi:hypothetical protein